MHVSRTEKENEGIKLIRYFCCDGLDRVQIRDIFIEFVIVTYLVHIVKFFID